MKLTSRHASRRNFLSTVGLAAASTGAARFFERGLFAEELQRRIRTPETTEGPFYPDHLPLDTDNDLLVVNDSITPAVGVITHLGGKILDASGSPLRNALVEIWQVDNFGSYFHTQGLNRHTQKRDEHFQGFGRFLTSSSGEYYFRTIRPVRYPGRTPHIHMKVKVRGQEDLTTQIFVKGEAQNDRDMVLNEIRDLAQRQSVITDFKPIQSSRIGELSATFDVVLGYTPAA